MIKPESYEPNTAERTLAEFMVAWKKRQWAEAASRLQITWAKNYHDPDQRLQAMFDAFKLRNAEIVKVETISDVMRDITVKAEYEFQRRILDKTIVARVICEAEPFTPDVNGHWGVNPTSMLRGWGA